MSTLSITIETINDFDFDDNPEQFKEAKGAIDGKAVDCVMSFETICTDEECKTAFKARLTDLEYEWDEEEE